MGVLVNHRLTTVMASLVAAVIVCLNLFLLYQQLQPIVHGGRAP